ncbi:MAG: hypothetical protein AABY64_05180 [Bdellovibrionota bacterium]
MKYFFKILLVFPLISSCGGNMYNDISSKNSAAALLEDAKNALDDQDYSTAITKILEMQSSNLDSYMTCRTTDGRRNCPREILAGAYAGKCGFNFLTFIGTISSSSGAVFKFLMNTFTSTTISPDDCYEAQKVIETIGTGSALTSDQQIFMALLGMAKIGVYLRDEADTDQDGATDVIFNSCDTIDIAGVSSGISDTNVKQVITGLGLFLTYSASLSSSGSATTDLSAISAVCGAACNVTDPDSPALDAAAVATFRDIMKSLLYGIETCDPISPLCCP